VRLDLRENLLLQDGTSHAHGLSELEVRPVVADAGLAEAPDDEAGEESRALSGDVLIVVAVGICCIELVAMVGESVELSHSEGVLG